MIDKSKIGLKGENIATEYLIKKGYQIVERRWRYKHKEIDIIAKLDKTIVFVEVKTRKNLNSELHSELIDTKKQLFLIEAANSFVEFYSDYEEVRFDVIFIQLSGKQFIINHIENAFNAI